VKRQILVYGACGGLLIIILQLVEYRFLVLEYSLEMYGAIVAAIFAALGIWLGLKLTKKEQVVVVREVPVPAPDTFILNLTSVGDLGITPRELEILRLIAAGLSNREIGERLFVSENTVKTHSSRLFEKLSAKRRTQAVQIGKELGLIP
jgi:DNA-binding CsgD family transcriptional regulator